MGIAALALLLFAATAAASCRDDVVDLRGPWGQARFTVELADTPDSQARGLMHRESLPRGAGMLFVYDSPRRVAFWMRNTLIPLDMIFMDATGTVTRIHHEAIPLDETPIDGGTGVLKVLEINGGLARRFGITRGSEMRHPRLDQDTAAWPCD
ncbi:hypothetical protein CCR87_06870 [Rhodobaculum claviforme]|uniref:DUF192 domain-containing protein n=2 Tax=Rhodobaculum claviforme TaxID=1549854 RepID=A0A934TJP2_9RHOB|nr:hypothetical protein [Rhodobaculum claviforme]